MERIKNIKELSIHLEKNGYKEEDINDFVELVKPFYEFYDYMSETYKMDYDQVEEDSSKYSESIFNEYLEDMSTSESPMKFMMEISGNIMERYAKKYEYVDSEKVKIALNTYTEILIKSTLGK